MSHNKATLNRELRWLSFNERVLMVAENPRTPLMERLKFIGIFSSNLDEFYAVRVGSLHRMVKDPQHHPAPPGVKPKELIRQILKEVQMLSKRMERCVEDIHANLKRHAIHLVDEQSVSPVQLDYIASYFANTVRNRLFPIMLDDNLPFPYLKHVTIYLAVRMHRSDNPKDKRYALIEVPTDMLARYIALPSGNHHQYFIMLDDIIRLRLKEIFSVFPYDVFQSHTIKITRDGEYDLADEVTKSLYEKLSTSLQQRSVGDPVRFVYDSSMPEDLLGYILERAHLDTCSNIIAGGRYHNARDMMAFPAVDRPALYFERQIPIPHHALRLPGSLIARIEERDHLLSLPYHRYDPVIDLLREASLDPSVLSIKMTLYRVAEDSSVINALRNAARNGKTVTLFIELQARFDEKTNMYWTEKLSREGNITLIGGVEGIKVHSKICVITRMAGKARRRIAMIGTGNFNEDTARLYSDHVLLTAHPKITEDADRVFDLLGSGFSEVKFKHLVVSPFHTRKQFVRLIKGEIANARKGLEARIVLKLNNLVDEKMIDHLVRAARAGVRIRLMIRGICSLSTDVPGVERGMIEGKSMIDRYLEHSRVITFHNGGNRLYYIGSADWMGRNLDNRIEVMTPVYDPLVKLELDHFLDTHWEDTYASFSLEADSFNTPLQTGQEGECRAQRDLYRWYRELGGGELSPGGGGV